MSESVNQQPTPLLHPVPRIGLVVRYSYIWRWQAKDGWQTAEKSRPCLMAAVRGSNTGKPVTLLLPITSREPARGVLSQLLPESVATSLQFAPKPCWLILSEGNIDVWPSRRAEPVPGNSKTSGYGIWPSRLFEPVLDDMRWALLNRRMLATNRSVPNPRGAAHPEQVFPSLARMRSGFA